MELLKKSEKYMEVLFSNNERISVEGDVIVPDVKPDVLKVLQVDAVSVITEKDVSNGCVYVEGKLKVNILYIPESDEECTGCIKSVFEFRDKFDIPVDEKEVKLKINSDVKRIEFTLINSRKLSIKANVSIDYEIIGEKEIEIPCGFDNSNAELSLENIKTERIIACDTYDFLINDSTELPSGKHSIKEILKTDAKIIDKEMKTVLGKLITKGSVKICTLYRASDDSIDFCEAEFPFTEVFDVYDITEEDRCSIDLEIYDLNSQICDDSDGDARIINFECMVNATIKAERQSDMTIISDCYIPGCNTSISYKPEKTVVSCGYIKEQKSIKEIITPDDKLPQIVKIYDVVGEIDAVKTLISDNRVNVDAKIKVYVLYLTDNKKCAAYTFKKDIPVSFGFNCDYLDEDVQNKTKLSIDHISYNINSMGEIELRCIIDFDIKLFKNIEVNLLCEVETEEKEQDSDIIIYFVQKGDTLWRIGKKYSIRTQDIIEINNLESDSIFPGQKLMIPPCTVCK